MIQEALPEKPETIEISNLDQFVQVLTGWHSQKVAVLEHMVDLPEGTEMVVDSGLATEATVIMAGDMLAGFRAGLDLALMELGTLPFLYEMEPEEDPLFVGVIA